MLLSAQRGNSTFEMNDVELLREYVARGCQDSFSELVRRHINLVYGTATRQVRDPHAVACIAYWRSAEGLEAWREQRSYGVKFEADGTFHADDVPPGEYTLRVMLYEARAESRVNETLPVGMPLSGSVGVPAGGRPNHDEPVNVGIVTLTSE
jgi:hypothetical protein